MEDIMSMNEIVSAGSQQHSEAKLSSNNIVDASNLPPTPPNTDPKKKSVTPNLQRTNSLSSKEKENRTDSRPSTATSASGSHKKRLSLSFPVLPPGAPAPSPSRQTSPLTSAAVSGASTPVDTGREAPEGSVTFFTALAAQERRVLELREELTKAEFELRKLKEHWSLHEAHKKRRELTFNAKGGSSAIIDDALQEALTSPTRREEYMRLQNSTRNSSGRRVLPSQRHQRTLSLLSPDRGRQGQPFPQPADVDTVDSPTQLTKRHTLMNPVSSRPVETSVQTRPQSMDLLDFANRRHNQEAIIQTGKQIADDFKEGLWHFIEDLKQATVGDDNLRAKVPAPTSVPNGSSKPNLRRVSSKASLRSVNNAAAIGKASSQAMQKALSKEKEKLASKGESLIDFGPDKSEPDLRDDASHRWSTSTTLSEVADGSVMSASRTSTPRTSTSSISRPINLKTTDLKVAEKTSNRSEQSPIWGTLANSAAFITPGQFKKHANALMSQVEKSFALPPPSPESEPETERVDSRATRSNSTGCSCNAADGGHGRSSSSDLRSRAASPTKLDMQA